jgi:ATPase subunit of ABC transporter with duplicated ATPase domains
MLDEPTNYLDTSSVEAVQRMIQAYPGTVILVSHDRAFVQAVTDREIRLDRGKITSAERAPERTPEGASAESGFAESAALGAASGKKRGTGETSAGAAADMEKMMLDMRRAELAAQIAAAAPERKEALERQYAALIATSLNAREF